MHDKQANLTSLLALAAVWAQQRPHAGETSDAVSFSSPLAAVQRFHPEYIPRVAGFFSAINAIALLMNDTEGESYANPKRLTRIYNVQGASRGCSAGSCTQCTTARWVESCLDGHRPLPEAIRLQLGCCLIATRQSADLPTALHDVDNRLARR